MSNTGAQRVPIHIGPEKIAQRWTAYPRSARSLIRTIDLEVPPCERWDNILAKDKSAIKKLLRQAERQIPGWAQLASPAMGVAYRACGGLYAEEIEALADWAGYDVGLMCMMQCSYELSHLAEYAGSMLGCTAGVVRDPKLGMIHLRTMDWDIPAISGATRLIRFIRGKREFVAVGIAGFVGVLSGMVPGAYSVTLNAAPCSEFPGFSGLAPAMLLRDVLESCDTMDEAVYTLSRTKLAAPVFFTVCGTDGALVIERTRGSYGIRNMRKGEALAQANHHSVARFRRLNQSGDEDVLSFSVERDKFMADQLASRHGSFEALKSILRKDPINNGSTHQRMIFRPLHGEVWLAL